MIIAKCPLRVSLVGGSTDLQDFVDHYGKGSVISFPTTLYTYIMINENCNIKKYRIKYSKEEIVTSAGHIKNDIARTVINAFGLPPIEVIFNSDIPSTGTGLASSSSYLLAFIKAADEYLGLGMSQFEICKKAMKLERQYNPLTGFQDIYGCGMGGLKRMDFYKDKVKFTYLDAKEFSKFDMHLIDTEVKRKSHKILKGLDLKSREKLLSFVDELEANITDQNHIFRLLNENWKQKKFTSNKISTGIVAGIDANLSKEMAVQGYKLLGAGAGGFFLVLALHNLFVGDIQIGIDNEGVRLAV